MALDTYDNLKAAVVRLTGRNDIALNVFDEALSIADKEVYANAVTPLRIREMETRATATLPTDSRFLALPDDFLMMRRLKLDLSLGDQDVRYRTPEQLPLYGDSGMPRFFTVTSQLEFERVPDSAYTIEMQYFKRFDIISSDNPTNVILTNFPAIYTYGCLSYVYKFSAEEEKAEYYFNQFINAIAGANKQDRRGRYGPSPVQRIEGVTP
ncbi:MAG: phage adaptor protein [Rickettsiales bacterium]